METFQRTVPKRMRNGRIPTSTGGGASSNLTIINEGTGGADILTLENEFIENNFFEKSVFAKTAVYIGNYDTANYAMMSYASNNLTISAHKFTIYDYVIERVEASLLKLTGNANITGNLEVDGNMQVDGAHTVTGNLSVGGNLSINGNIDRYNQTELNIGDTFINLGTAQDVAIDGGMRIYGPGTTLLSTIKYVSASGLWLVDKPWALSLTNKLAFNSDAANYYLQYSDTTYGIKGNSLHGWTLYGANNLGLNISATGKVSIGSIAGSEMFTVNSATGVQTAAHFTNLSTGTGAGNGFIVGIEGAGNGIIWHREESYIRFGTSAAERMRILSTGEVGIGTTTPSYLLHIRKDQNAATALQIQNGTSGTSSYTRLALVGVDTGLFLYNFDESYTATSNRQGRSEITSTAPNGLQIYNPNYLRFQNELGTDIFAIIAGSNYSYGALYAASTVGKQGSVPGFIGQGWQVDSDGNMYVKSLEVRESLRVYSLEVEQMKVSTGSQLFTAGVEIADIATNTFYYEDKGYDRFSVGDILRCQQWNGSLTTDLIKFYQIQVTAIGTTTLNSKTVRYVTYSNKAGSGTVASGDMICKVGNTNLANSTVLEVTSRDGAFLQIANGITTTAGNFITQYRVGYVQGLTSTAKGSAASGYGLWSDKFVLDSTGAYLAGTINAYSGKIGQTSFWNFDKSGNLWSGYQYGEAAGIQLSSLYRYVAVYTSDDDYVMMYQTDANNWGLVGELTGNTIFSLGSLNKIAAFTFDTNSLYTGTKQTSEAYTVNANSLTLGTNYLRMYNFRVDTTGNMYARGGAIGNIILDAYGMYRSINITTPATVGKLFFGNSDYQKSIGVYLDNDNGTDGGCAVGQTKAATLGRLRAKDSLATWSNDYGFEVLKRTATSTYEHILRIGGSEAFIGGFNFDDYKLYTDNVLIETVKAGKSTQAQFKTYGSDSGAYLKSSLSFSPSTSYCGVYGNSNANNVLITGSNSTAKIEITQNNALKVLIDPVAGYSFEKNTADTNTKFKIKDLPIHNYVGEPSLESGQLYLLAVGGRYQLFVKS